MKTTLSILLLATIFILGFLASTIPIRDAKAATTTGKVCIADPTTANLGLTLSPENVCSPLPPTFNGPWTNASSPAPPQPSPTQIKVGVYVNDSDPMNGFGITLIANHSILTAVDADLSGTILVGLPTILTKCIGAVLKVGSTCDPTYDTVDTITLKVTGGLGQFTSIHTTGLLFTAIYNITGHTPATGITVNFQTGCTNTSVSGNVCVTVSNGSGVGLETAQNGQFNNNTPPPFISISANQTVIGPRISPYSRNVTITANSQNGWPGFSTDSVAFSTLTSPGLSATIIDTNPCSVGSTSCSVTVTVTATKAGSVTIRGNYSTVDLATAQTTTLIAPVTLSVVVQDFSVSVSSMTVYISPNGAPIAAATITVASLNGFTGPVTVGDSTITPPGLTVSYNPSSFTLPAGGSQNSMVMMSSTTMNEYTWTIKAASGSLTHTTPPVRVFVNSFTVTANPSMFSFDAGTTGSTTLTLQSYPVGNTLNGFAGTVTLTNSTVPGLGPKAPCPATATLTAGGSATVTCNFSSTVAGTYTMRITGSGGSNSVITNSTSITATVVRVFGFSASPTALNVNATADAASTITASDQGGFSGTVDLSYTVSPTTGLTCTFKPTSITVPSGGQGTSTLSCNGSPGIYTLTVTGTATGLTPKTVAVTYTVQDFSVTAGPASPNPVLAGATIASTITVSPINGYTGNVALTATVSAGASCTLSPASQTLGTQFTSYLSCSASVVGDYTGDYTVTVTGTSQPYIHTTAAILFRVADFTVNTSLVTPSSVNVGSTGSFTVSLNNINGFSESVSLSVLITPTSGLTASCSPQAIAGSVSSTCTFSASVLGDYRVTITGADGTLSHYASQTVHVPASDFSLSASPTTVYFTAGGSEITTVTMTTLNGFSGSVSFVVSVSPSGLDITCSPQTTTGSATSVCNFFGRVVGTYTVTIKGTSGGLSHTVTVIATVKPPPGIAILGLNPTVFYSTLGVVIGIVLAGSVLLIRRRSAASRRPKQA